MGTELTDSTQLWQIIRLRADPAVGNLVAVYFSENLHKLDMRINTERDRNLPHVSKRERGLIEEQAFLISLLYTRCRLEPWEGETLRSLQRPKVRGGCFIFRDTGRWSGHACSIPSQLVVLGTTTHQGKPKSCVRDHLVTKITVWPLTHTHRSVIA